MYSDGVIYYYVIYVMNKTFASTKIRTRALWLASRRYHHPTESLGKPNTTICSLYYNKYNIYYNKYNIYYNTSS